MRPSRAFPRAGRGSARAAVAALQHADLGLGGHDLLLQPGPLRVECQLRLRGGEPPPLAGALANKRPTKRGSRKQKLGKIKGRDWFMENITLFRKYSRIIVRNVSGNI